MNSWIDCIPRWSMKLLIYIYMKYLKYLIWCDMIWHGQWALTWFDIHVWSYKRTRASDSSSSKQPRPLLPRPRPSSTISGASIATAQQSHQKKGLSSALTHPITWNILVSQNCRPTADGNESKQKKSWHIFDLCNISLSKNVQSRSNKAAPNWQATPSTPWTTPCATLVYIQPTPWTRPCMATCRAPKKAAPKHQWQRRPGKTTRLEFTICHNNLYIIVLLYIFYIYI